MSEMHYKWSPNQTFAQWVSIASRLHKSNLNGNNLETGLLRGNRSLPYLHPFLSSVDKPNVLIAGLGFDNDPLRCSYAPYKIAARLENINTRYRMTLVDIDHEVTEDIMIREKIYAMYHDYSGDLFYRCHHDWESYLQETGQPGEVIHERERDLRFYDYVERNSDHFSPQQYLSEGISAANIPNSFKVKRLNGDISIVTGDIALVKINQHGLYNFVDLVNILYLLDHHGQILTISRIAKMMATGAGLVMNDLAYSGNPVFENFGGWLNVEILDQLGLRIEDVNGNSNVKTYLLIKN